MYGIGWTLGFGKTSESYLAQYSRNDWVSSDSVKNTPIEELHSKHPSLEKTEEESEEDLDNDETRMVEETESRNL